MLRTRCGREGTLRQTALRVYIIWPLVDPYADASTSSLRLSSIGSGCRLARWPFIAILLRAGLEPKTAHCPSSREGRRTNHSPALSAYFTFRIQNSKSYLVQPALQSSVSRAALCELPRSALAKADYRSLAFEEGTGGIYSNGIPHYALYLWLGKAFGADEMYSTPPLCRF
jgi:hypothetical protein